MTGPEPLRPTTARWKNKRRRVRDDRGEWTDKWAKVLAHEGGYEQFRYGTHTETTWTGNSFQKAIICSPWSGVIAVDVDNETEYKTTRTGQLIGREHAISTRGRGYHILIDARGVPPGQWPFAQRPIAGADIKSCGFIPVPGSWHYSGELYEPVPGARVLAVTPELIGAILADQADLAASGGGSGGHGGTGGHGGGHDGEVAASVLANVLRGLDKEQCYQEWLKVAIGRDPGDPFTRKDFERHYGDETRGALAKAAEIKAKEAATVTTGAEQWAAANTPGAAATDPAVSARMAAQARHELDQHNRKWLYDADVYQLDFILCVAITAASTEDGEKLWGIVVGGSSSAKSEDIKMVFGVADARLGDLTAAGLLSWMGTGKNIRTTGLLKHLPSPALVLIEDLAPLMADTADKRNRSKLVSMLRKVYDGEVQRDLGGMPGQAVWHGKVTMLAASTKVIDQQSALIDDAGPRWLLYRGQESSARTRLAGTGQPIDGKKRAAQRGQAHELAAAVVRHGRDAFGHMALSEDAARSIGDIAVVTGTLRGSVPRDGYGKREIIGIAATEEPWRLEAQLQLLARAAMSFGHTQDSAVALARRVALGTVPPDRMKVLEVLTDGGKHNATAIGRAKEMHRLVAGRALEDLQQLRVTECENEDQESDVAMASGTRWWRIGQTEIANKSAQVIKDDVVSRKVVNTPPAPPDREEVPAHNPLFVSPSEPDFRMLWNLADHEWAVEHGAWELGGG